MLTMLTNYVSCSLVQCITASWVSPSLSVFFLPSSLAFFSGNPFVFFSLPATGLVFIPLRAPAEEDRILFLRGYAGRKEKGQQWTENRKKAIPNKGREK